MRRLAGVVLVAFALLAGPLPKAVAQEPARPEPRELWRQFPLDSEPSNQQAPTERRSAPRVSAPTNRSTGEGGRGRSLPTVQIAAIVLTMALLLMLTTGALAYATRGQFELSVDGLKGRRRRAFRQFIDAPRAARTGGRQFAVANRVRRRSMRAAAAHLREMRAMAANLRKRIVANGGALKANVDARTVPADTESTASELGTLKERLDMYFAPGKSESTADDELENLKAKPDVHPASTSSPADDALEILKAKLGKPAGPVDVERPDEVETLKAKLAGNAAAAEAETTTRNVLKTKLVERGAPPKTSSKKTVSVASLKAKLDVRDEAANDQAPVSVDIDASDATAEEPQTGAADSMPVSPGRAPAASRRSTAAAARRPSSPAKRSTLGAAPHVEPTPAPSQLLALPIRTEQQQPYPSECRIAWWRGYVKSTFYAVARTAAGEEQLVAESPHFRWRKPGPPPHRGPALEAHRALVERLEQDGWSVVGAGRRWYASKLQRKQARRRSQR